MLTTIVNQITNATWVSIVISGGLGYLALSLSLRNSSHKRVILDLVLNGGIIFLVIYKAIPILMSPGFGIGSGFLSLLLSNGISEGLYAGGLGSLLYIFLKMKHQDVSSGILVEKLPLGILVSFMAFHLLNWNVGRETMLLWGITLQDPMIRYHPVSMYQLIICILFFIHFLTQNEKARMNGFAAFCFLFSCSQVFISYFLMPSPYVFGFSMFQLFFLFVAAVSSIQWMSPSIKVTDRNA